MSGCPSCPHVAGTEKTLRLLLGDCRNTTHLPFTVPPKHRVLQISLAHNHILKDNIKINRFLIPFETRCTYFFPVQPRCHSAILRIRLIDFWIRVQQPLHGSITVKGRHIKQHLAGIKWKEKWAAKSIALVSCVPSSISD